MDAKQKAIIAAIKKAPAISLFFHEKPDPDTLGCAFGLRQFVRDNFPDKKVGIAGLQLVAPNEAPDLFDMSERVDDEFIASSLAIVVDTANRPRIQDQRYQLAKKLIKIDHHPLVDEFGDISYVKDDVSSAAQIVADTILQSPYKVSPKAAMYLYAGMVTDTGNFRFHAVDDKTHDVVARLLRTGMDKSAVYASIGSRTVADTRAAGFILSHYKVKEPGIAYMTVKSTRGLRFTPDEVKNLINTLSGIEGIEVWSICIYDSVIKKWRASFRSRSVVINKTVETAGGGGHRHAAGSVLDTLEDYWRLLDRLADLIYDHRKQPRKKPRAAAKRSRA